MNPTKAVDRTEIFELIARHTREVLPDLDAIILRGSNRDVNEVLRIIEDIERISAEAVPEVEVVTLQHASSEALAPTGVHIAATMPRFAGR